MVAPRIEGVRGSTIQKYTAGWPCVWIVTLATSMMCNILVDLPQPLQCINDHYDTS